MSQNVPSVAVWWVFVLSKLYYLCAEESSGLRQMVQAFKNISLYDNRFQ